MLFSRRLVRSAYRIVWFRKTKTLLFRSNSFDCLQIVPRLFGKFPFLCNASLIKRFPSLIIELWFPTEKFISFYQRSTSKDFWIRSSESKVLIQLAGRYLFSCLLKSCGTVKVSANALLLGSSQFKLTQTNKLIDNYRSGFPFVWISFGLWKSTWDSHYPIC